MEKILLSEMTIQSLFTMSNIPYEPNVSFEEKVTILKNANLLQKEQNYSNHTELSENDKTDVIHKSTLLTPFEQLLSFFGLATLESLDFVTQVYNMPSDKYKEGIFSDNYRVKVKKIKDNTTKKTIQINETLFNASDDILVIFNYNLNGKFTSHDRNGYSMSGDWFITSTNDSIGVNYECEGYFDLYGKYVWINTQKTKTPSGTILSENKVKFARNGLPTIFEFTRSVPISPNPTPSHKLPQIKEGKWQYKRTYYYIDESNNLVGPDIDEVELSIEKLQEDFYKIFVVNTDYNVLLNVVNMNNIVTIIRGINLVDDTQYELVPTVIKNNIILEAEGWDQAFQGIRLVDNGLKTRSASKISAKFIRN